MTRGIEGWGDGECLGYVGQRGGGREECRGVSGIAGFPYEVLWHGLCQYKNNTQIIHFSKR